MKFPRFKIDWNKLQVHTNSPTEVKNSKSFKKLKTKQFDEFAKMMKELKVLNQGKLLIQIEEYLSTKSKIEIKDVEHLIHFDTFEKLWGMYLKYINLTMDNKQYLSVFNNKEMSSLIEQTQNSNLFVFTKECYVWLNHDHPESESIMKLFLGRPSLKSGLDNISRPQSRRTSTTSVTSHK